MESVSQDTIRIWLRSWDFIDNPFALAEALQETRRQPPLEHYFVKRPFFDQLLKENKSTLVFAPRGGGKSATHFMLKSECRPNAPTASVLAISLEDFSLFADRYLTTDQPTFQEHLQYLVPLIAQELIQALAVNPSCVSELTPDDLGKLRYWLDPHQSYIFNRSFLHSAFRLLMAQADERDIEQLISSIQQGSSLPNIKNRNFALFAQTVFNLRLSPAISPDYPIDSPIRSIESFVELILEILSKGSTACRAIYLLIDGVDEYPLTKDDPEACARLLLPLIGNQKFLELPGLVTKLFLPIEYRRAIERVTRPDRLEIITLTWDSLSEKTGSDDLRQVLRRRIFAFNTRGMNTLSEMCDPTLRRWLEDAMLEEAHDSPRSLMRLGNLLFSEHCRETPSLGSELLPAEWERAKERFRAADRVQPETQHTSDFLPSTIIPVSSSSSDIPRLRVDLRKRKVYRGKQEVPFPSDLEYRLIEFLYRHKGQICTKHEIVLAVYEPKYGSQVRIVKKDGKEERRLKREAEETTLSQLIKRLRQRIEKKPAKPVYVITHKGRGYQLENAE